MAPRPGYIAVGWIFLAALSVPAGAHAQMSHGGGMVLDTTSRQPVAGAAVTLECRRRQPHGSALVRDAATRSDGAGLFQFSAGDVAGCDFAYVRPAKAGYEDAAGIDPGYGYTSYERIPKVLYLTPQADAVMLRLAFVTPKRSPSVFNLDGSVSPLGEYRLWYQGFYQAKHLARTARERRFVHERYCTRLPALYATLSDAEKGEAERHSVSYAWRGESRTSRHDYRGEVQPYCAQPPDGVSPHN